jgi:hypothetical protein
VKVKGKRKLAFSGLWNVDRLAGAVVGEIVASEGGVGVAAGAHPLSKTVSTTNTKNIDFFMTLSPFDLIAQDCA